MWLIFPIFFQNDFLLKAENGEERLPNLSDLKVFDVRLKYSLSRLSSPPEKKIQFLRLEKLKNTIEAS